MVLILIKILLSYCHLNIYVHEESQCQHLLNLFYWRKQDIDINWLLWHKYWSKLWVSLGYHTGPCRQQFVTTTRWNIRELSRSFSAKFREENPRRNKWFLYFSAAKRKKRAFFGADVYMYDSVLTAAKLKDVLYLVFVLWFWTVTDSAYMWQDSKGISRSVRLINAFSSILKPNNKI